MRVYAVPVAERGTSERRRKEGRGQNKRQAYRSKLHG